MHRHQPNGRQAFGASMGEGAQAVKLVIFSDLHIEPEMFVAAPAMDANTIELVGGKETVHASS